MSCLESPTLRLLSSSVPVGASGALRLYIAFLLAGIVPVILPCIASGLVIYATYSLDRAIPCVEDTINQSGLAGANRWVATSWCSLTYIGGLVLFIREGIYIAPLLPLVIGYFYTKGLVLGPLSLKLKRGAGVKNAVIGLTWGGSIALVVAHWTNNPLTILSIFLFFCMKLFINSALFDMKDVEGDLAAGIQTIPACLGEHRAKRFLTSLSIFVHVVMFLFVIAGYLRPELVILTYSGFVGISFISFYSPEWEKHTKGIKKHLREITIDGESALALSLRSLTKLVPVVPVLGYG